MSCGFDRFWHHQQRMYTMGEGCVSTLQVQYLTKLVQGQLGQGQEQEHEQKEPGISRVVEVGFNGGLSSAALLGASDTVTVTSFDIGRWDYVPAAKELIDQHFPGRHQLVLGDSTQTLPPHAAAFGGSYDLAFVDGGHLAPVPEQDIANCLQLLKPGGLLLVDDYCQAWGSGGVVQAYDAAVSAGLIVTVDGPHYEGDRGWVLAQKAA